VHSNVGGGYPDDSLANVSLSWMLAEAQAADLKLKKFPGAEPDALINADSAKDKDGRLYDSRNGLGGYYRYSPRKIDDSYLAMPPDPKNAEFSSVPKIHESVFSRIKVGAHHYAPIGLPVNYEVVKSGDITVKPQDFTINPISPTVTPNAVGIAEGQASHARYTAQEGVWNNVWRRRVIYFLTVFASLHLALYPLYRDSYAFEELRTRLRIVSDAIRLVGGVLPGLASRWLEAYARDPAWFLVSAGLVAFLIWIGAKLGWTITDRMRRIWAVSLPGARIPPSDPETVSVFRRLRRAAFTAVLLYVACYPLISGYAGLAWLRLPHASQALPDTITPHNLATAYTASPVWLVIFAFLVAYYTPERVVQTLRLSPLYQGLLRLFRDNVWPALSAVAILFLAIAFGNHYLFNIRDSFGAFCKPTMLNGEPLSLKNHGFGPNWKKQAMIDTSPGNNDLCISLGVFVKTGDRYRIVVNRKPFAENDPLVGRWTFFGEDSYMGGQPVSHLSQGKAAVMGPLFPLRRTFDRPWGAVILRIGSRGSEEDFLDRSPPPQKDDIVAANHFPIPDKEQLAEILKPKRDGELYVYLNRPVLGWWGYESWISRNWIGNTGKAEIIIEAMD
jgi:hypothetical protein